MYIPTGSLNFAIGPDLRYYCFEAVNHVEVFSWIIFLIMSSVVDYVISFLDDKMIMFEDGAEDNKEHLDVDDCVMNSNIFTYITLVPDLYISISSSKWQ